jgi:hypothetical protein
VHKIRNSAVLATFIAILTFSAPAAFAQFESRVAGGVNHGVFNSAAGTFSVSETTSVTCEENSGEWKTRAAGEAGKQAETKVGPHLVLSVSPTKCTATVGGLKIAATISGSTKAQTACEFELKQPNKGELKAVGSVDLPCFISVPAAGCTITAPAFNEKTGENFQLGTVTLENVKENQVDTVALSGLTSIPSSEAACGVAANKGGKIKIKEVIEAQVEV